MPRARILAGLNERATNIAAITLVALTPLSLLKDVSALAFTSLLGCVAVVNTALADRGDPRALAQHAYAHYGARAWRRSARARPACTCSPRRSRFPTGASPMDPMPEAVPFFHVLIFMVVGQKQASCVQAADYY